MATLSAGEEVRNEQGFVFASLTPVNIRTRRSIQHVLDSCDQHHQAFIRQRAGDLAATLSPSLPSGSYDTCSGVTTEAYDSDGEFESFESSACYVLTFGEQTIPCHPEVGWSFGLGDVQKFPTEHAGVDILIPPANFEDPRQPITGTNLVQNRQGHFAFDSTYAQLWIHARHSGVTVDARPIRRGEKRYLPERCRISIGPYRFIFQFKVPEDKEQMFQRKKMEFLSQYRGLVNPHESTSPTPSTTDVQIQDWRLHGIVGVSPVSTIHAATNVKSGEVVAVKRLRFGGAKKNAEEEVQLYRDLRTISNHRYGTYIMRMHSVLTNDRQFSDIREVYLLWKPLARGTFSQFGILGRWYHEPDSVKTYLFVQVLCGLSAFHDNGWIHRDIKPANLGVVELGETPHAVIMDEGQAIRSKRPGHIPSIAHCGTIGYLAPEVENEDFAAFYDNKIDVWSMGAVAYYLFCGGRIPWSVRCNMFVPKRNAQEQSLDIFREIRAGLMAEVVGSIRELIGRMLDENPHRRPSIAMVLTHPAIQPIRRSIEKTLDDRTTIGQKRNRD